MSPTLIGITGIVVLVLFMAQHMPVAFAMLAVGFGGVAILNGFSAAAATLVSETWVVASFYELTVIPLFVLMGNLASLCGMSRELYAAAYAWVGHMRGGLASATIIACTGFAALSGSSVASALTLGRVSLPEMARYGYDGKLAAGAVAAGGTLGFLIPPSTGFVIYAILTEESIGRLFLAGVFPGLLLATLFVITIVAQTTIYPELGPRAARIPVRQRVKALARGTAIVVIIVITIGGIYGGVFTPVEAAAVGVVLVVGVAILRRTLTILSFRDALLQSLRTTLMIVLIIIGANIFAPFLALTGIPGDLTYALTQGEIGPVGLLFIVLATFIFLGTFLDGFAMMVLILPIVLPIFEQSGVPAMLGLQDDPSGFRVWFGVVMVIVLEMALISPPVGLNVFVVKSVARDLAMRDIYIGVLPFWAAMILCVLILVAFPDIALLLPNTMISR